MHLRVHYAAMLALCRLMACSGLVSCDPDTQTFADYRYAQWVPFCGRPLQTSVSAIVDSCPATPALSNLRYTAMHCGFIIACVHYKYHNVPEWTHVLRPRHLHNCGLPLKSLPGPSRMCSFSSNRREPLGPQTSAELVPLRWLLLPRAAWRR